MAQLSGTPSPTHMVLLALIQLSHAVLHSLGSKDRLEVIDTVSRAAAQGSSRGRQWAGGSG